MVGRLISYNNRIALSIAGTTLALVALCSAGGTGIPTPSTQNAYAQGSLIGDVNVPINVDITAIVPINVNIQNAQICLQVAGGSCTQVVLNPTQQTYSPTTVDLSQPTPTITPTTTTAPTTTTQPSTTTTTPTTTTPITQPPTTGTTGTPTTTTTSPSTTSPSTSSSPTTTSPSTSSSPTTSDNTGGSSTGGSSGGSTGGGSSGSSGSG